MSPIRFARQNGRLKAAVVGAGAFGRHHAAKYRGLEGVELLAVADPSADARKSATATHGVRAVADWRELLGKVDVVSVASPAVTHAEIVRAFLNAGAHVLVEKPIATSIEEADALIALAEKMGLILTVGHQERFVFARTGLLDYEDSPLEVSCWRMGPWSGRGTDVSVVLDLMIHDLDLVHQLIPGKVRSVHAHGRVERASFADEASAAVLFENGAVARLETSRVAESRRRGMRAVYADGAVEIDFLARKIGNTTPRALNALETGDPLAESVAAFVAAARNGKAPLVRPRQARRALETALLIDEASDRSGALRSRRELAAYAAAN